MLTVFLIQLSSVCEERDQLKQQLVTMETRLSEVSRGHDRRSVVAERQRDDAQEELLATKKYSKDMIQQLRLVCHSSTCEIETVLVFL